MQGAAVDPNVFLTVVFVCWVALFALAVAAVVRHERSRDAATSASASLAGEATQSDATRERAVPQLAEDERRIQRAERGETAAVLNRGESGKSH